MSCWYCNAAAQCLRFKGVSQQVKSRQVVDLDTTSKAITRTLSSLNEYIGQAFTPDNLAKCQQTITDFDRQEKKYVEDIRTGVNNSVTNSQAYHDIFLPQCTCDDD